MRHKYACILCILLTRDTRAPRVGIAITREVALFTQTNPQHFMHKIFTRYAYIHHKKRTYREIIVNKFLICIFLLDFSASLLYNNVENKFERI